MNIRRRNLIEIHIAVLLFGLTGLFGKAIDIPARYIVLGRVFFASLSMGLFFMVRGKSIRLRRASDYPCLLAVGLILALHWTSFYTSVQVSTVAIALLTFSAYPIFVTFLEPVFFHERLKGMDVLFSLVMFAGVVLVVPEFNIKNNMTIGMLWGMLGSISFAVMSLLNRKFASRYDGSTVAFYEQAAASAALMPMLFFDRPAVSPADWGLLVLLGVLFTGVAHSLFIGGMQNVRAQTAGIIAGLETVYGIISAALLLGEIPSIKELSGGFIILGTALISTLRSSKEENK